jgi:hypothetical protein
MSMSTGTGLDGQLGVKAETTWGTPVTVDRFFEFNSETLEEVLGWLEPTGIRAGQKYKRGARARVARRGTAGQVTMEHATRGMALWWKHALGSAITAPTQIETTAAYKSIITPGDFRGLGLTVQVGRPEAGTGTVRPFTYSGCKVSGWTISVTDNAIPTLQLTLDGREESTTAPLAAATYLDGTTVFDFSQASLRLGGTVATASGETTISGGTAVATVVREFNVSGTVPMANERYGLGNAGRKSQQLENGTPTVTGSLAAEFSKEELYDVYKAGDAVPLEFVLLGDVIEDEYQAELSIILPEVKFKKAAPQVSGPDVVQMTTDIEAYSNEEDPVIQVRLISTDTTL